MKVSIPKNTKLDILATYGSLNTFLRIFSLSCVSRDGTNLKWSWPIWKISLTIVFVIAANGLTVYFKINNFNTESTTHTFKEVIQIVYLVGYQQYLIDIALAYKYGRQQYVDYLKLYEQFDNMLGTYYYKEIKVSIRNVCYAFSVIGLISVVADYIGWSMSFGTIIPTVYMIDYVYAILKMLSVLDMISNYTQMWYRLKAVADTLEDYYVHCQNMKDVVKELTNLRVSKVIQLDCFKSIKFNRINVVMDLPRLYLLLIDQCDYLNVKHEIKIVMNSAALLLDMVMMLNLLIRLAMGTLDIPENSGNILIISTAVRIISCSIVLVTGIYRCEQSYRQNERILRLIDHFMLLKRIPFEVREILKELKILLLTKAVRYNAMSFYQLEYATLVSLSSAVVTNTIILLQNIQ